MKRKSENWVETAAIAAKEVKIHAEADIKLFWPSPTLLDPQIQYLKPGSVKQQYLIKLLFFSTAIE